MFYRMAFDSRRKHQSFISPIRAGNDNVNESDLIRHEGQLSIAGNLRGEIAHIGTLNDINFGSHDILICNERATAVLKGIASEDIQTIPIEISGERSPLYLIHILSVLDCVDKKLSEYTLWTSTSSRPELAGQFEMMIKMVIDPTKTHGRRILRAKGWEIAAIVDETVKEALEAAQLTGPTFRLLA
jgi:hypothetical protein